METEEEKNFWKSAKEVFEKTWKWIVALIVLIFGIKAVSDDNNKKDTKQEIKDKKKEIKQDQKDIDKDIKDIEKKEKEIEEDIQDLKDKAKDKDKDIGQFLPDLEKE